MPRGVAPQPYRESGSEDLTAQSGEHEGDREIWMGGFVF